MFYYPCNLDDDATYEEVEEYKRLSRSYAKNYYKALNEQFLNKIDVIGFFNKYISSYAPIVEFDFTIENYLKYGIKALTELSNNSRVTSIVVSGESQVQTTPQISGASSVVVAFDYNTRGYTGDGVTVGILEPGIVDKNHSNFTNTDLTVRRVWYYSETVTEHTTQMASIIGGDNGIAPDAKLLSVETFGSLTGEIDWLLDNNVDIVNMSFANTESIGTYSDESAYIDYIAYYYNVTFIACASNNINGDSKVANPGLGYNVITVGSTTYSDYICGFSSYLTDDFTFKPDIYVPGSDIGVPGFSQMISGTSVSAALMSGYTALLMERFPVLKTRPEAIKATACATARYLGTTHLEGNGYDDLCGAGRFHYQYFVESYNFFTQYLTSTSTSSSILYDIDLVFLEGETLTVCLTWLVKTDGTVDGLEFTSYFFDIKDSSGNLIHRRLNWMSNTEYLRCEVPYRDTYNVKVARASTDDEMINPSGEHVAFDLRIEYLS